MKQIQPWMPERLEEAENMDCLMEAKNTEERLEERLFKKQNAENEDFSLLCFSKVRFENCCFLGCSFVKCEFTDVIFQSCNFSNCTFTDAYFDRCRILTSKGMGADFSGSTVKNMTVSDCCLNYANFDNSKLEKVKFHDSELNHCNLSQCRCKDVEWDRVQLNHASFFKTPLKGMDFTTCAIGELTLADDCRELKGAVVDLYQAADLAKRLGIVIKQ